jgi:hypothetical protein
MTTRTIIPRGAPQNAIGLTTVLPFSDYHPTYTRLWFVLFNEDLGVEELTAIGDISRKGSAKNGELRRQAVAPAGEEARIELDLRGPEVFARVAVQSDGSTVSFSWELIGEDR